MVNENNQAIWDAYNYLLLSEDIERLRKLVVRYDLFRQTIEVPGDIVECGVFKGTGLMLWLKLLQIHAPASAKRVIGFDTFADFGASDTEQEADQVKAFLEESAFDGISPDSLYDKIIAAGIDVKRCDLVVGDIRETAPNYLTDKPGLRLSLLHIDMDLESAAYAALEAFWPRLVTGGLAIFDNFGIARWSESNGVDRYFEDKQLALKTLPYSRTPTAYIIKGSK
jgi:hypothetical protein